MSNGIFGVGLTGLRAAQIGLSTAGHNITNASTPGYNRQEIVQTTNVPLSTGSGFIGQGTNVSTVRRIYSQFLDNQVQSAQTQSSYLDAYYAQLSQVDNMLADANAGLSPALQDFFSGVQDVATNPSSVSSRQSMMSDSQALISRFQALNQRFEELRSGVNSQVIAEVGVINGYAQQIAQINQQIIVASGSANGQPPNDLFDQRDKIISDLNKEVNVSVVKQSDGSYNIFMGQGQALVVGQQAFSLTARPSADDPSRMDVAYVSNNSVLFLPQGSLDGGNLGGLLAFRSESLDQAQNQLGLVAIGLAQTFNDQHRLGQDLNGNPGGYYFNVRGPSGIPGANAVPNAKVVSNTYNAAGSGVPDVTLTDISNVTASDYTLTHTAGGYSLVRLSDNSAVFTDQALPQVVDGLTIAAPAVSVVGDKWLIQPTREGAKDISLAITSTSEIAAAAPIRTAVADTNTGLATISAGVVNPPPPPNANLLDNVTISFIDATHFSVTDNTTATVLAASVVYDPVAGATLTYNGWTAQLNGAAAAGDSFTVGPNTNGVSDNRNALLLAGLQSKNTLLGSSATYQGTYAQLVSSVGVKTRDIKVTGAAQAALVTQTQQAQQSMSGVNLDEEAANLLRYQQAYQASGKMMQVATTVFDLLLTLGQ